MSKPSWNAYFMDFVELVKTHSTCLKRQVGVLQSCFICAKLIIKATIEQIVYRDSCSDKLSMIKLNEATIGLLIFDEVI